MTTINLYQNDEEIKQRKAASAANGGFWFSLSILMLTLIALFILRFYVGNIQKSNELLKAQVAQENLGLSGIKNLQHVLDVQNRLTEINKNLGLKGSDITRLKMTNMLVELEKSMNSGVTLSSYEYDSEKKKVSIVFESHNFNDSARQILNFKKSAYFTDAQLDDITRTEKNIVTDMSMSVKDEK